VQMVIKMAYVLMLLCRLFGW